ncbi:hypothetical protein H3Z85_07945 [Chryseobacterium indologenes]|uniref:alpha-glutamyl/putrescinyl thymine pyrophosphorylase clade 3 protein n=1 Tax=Chryseobacterium indologenes TaxID=253 RepID=UPI0003E078D2|nr:hypothetical protein [Chryseobacterium indologenes]QPQ53271.1 hypothetical protein H3Z85_07945 [Chryseobacterium indologenes]GAE63565.1 hypothetical protein CIN01S_04_01710 [Chryseobacterium indologenes NBRC 14944]SFJ64691.1 hypothetical protein SAMN05421692_2244 [Chryseobacterium indologenes]SUX52091.1 Uncharacterised protein [Chryseobacterium indologenes]
MKNQEIYTDIKTRLDLYRESVDLPGLRNAAVEDSFIRQFIDSHKRIKFIEKLKTRVLNDERKNPNSDLYDPIRASILYLNEGNINEAVWNIFLYVHFGKNIKSNYELIKAVYGKLGDPVVWSWDQITNNPVAFRTWLGDNITDIKRRGNFGNHRKYQSLKINTHSGTYQTFMSFFELVNNDFGAFISTIPATIKADKNAFFDYLYKYFNSIRGFGRLAVFDFLCMVGKVGILEIEPNNPYLGNGGPIAGTKLLFDSPAKTRELNDFLKDIGNAAFDDYPFIMQILEDCVCNWQKSPMMYKLFRG